eukprot:2415618-Pleurochrysis_carterae.AAC.2
MLRKAALLRVAVRHRRGELVVPLDLLLERAAELGEVLHARERDGAPRGTEREEEQLNENPDGKHQQPEQEHWKAAAVRFAHQ